MAIYLTRNEIVLCFGVYFLALSYGLYHAYEASNGESLATVPKKLQTKLEKKKTKN